MRSRLSNKALTAERLREALNYDPETGIFSWAAKRNRVLIGSIAGSSDNRGYWRVVFDGKDYWLHRLAWLYVHGEWPSKEVDHKNGNKSDNRIANLRLVTRGENMRNIRAHADNKSRMKGVRLSRGRWEARITVSGRDIYLGGFATPEMAQAAYAEAAKKYHGEFYNTGAANAPQMKIKKGRRVQDPIFCSNGHKWQEAGFRSSKIGTKLCRVCYRDAMRRHRLRSSL